MNIESIMDFLVDRRDDGVLPEDLSKVFTSLLPCLPNEGKEVVDVTRNWLQGDDEYRVAIALNLAEVYPADTRAELVELRDSIGRRHPSLVTLADNWIDRWDRQYPGR